MRKLLISTFLLLSLCLAQAQNIPLNPNVIHGQLENGFTYYIEKNTRPENRVELRLAINVGSIVEDEDQLGLAHFMEHMNFNGTKNFPGNSLIDNLQSIGVRFGQHLNAYTSFDETVYMLPIPLENPENLEIGMKILEDWAFNAVLSDEEINKERGVVLEELRLGLGADKRMLDEYLPKVLYKSQYAKRLPIGKQEIIENFDPEVIRRFHQDWHRPDLMAMIVVGDIDPQTIENKIKSQFSKYKNPKQKRERPVYTIPNHKETFIAIASDPETSFSRVQIYYKDLVENQPVQTIDDYNDMLIKSVFSHMLNARLNEIANSPNPPFTFAGSYHGDTWARTKQAYQSYAMTAEGEQLQALKVILEENERVRKFGFNQSELERSKNEILSWVERNYNERNNTESNRKVTAYLNHFLENRPAPGIEWEYEQYQNILPQIQLAEVNALIEQYIRDENRVVVLTGPEKENLIQPTEQEVLNVLNSIDVAALEPYEDEVLIENLVKNLPTKGQIIKTEVDEDLDKTIWTLSNGAKLIYKKTDFKTDEILFRAIRLGGNSTLSDEDYNQTKWAFGALSEAGLNGYSKVDIDKYLSGKQVYLMPSFGSNQLYLSGQSTPRDLETLFELIHANFTGINHNQEAYESYVTKQNSFYANLSSQPQFYFMMEHAKLVAGDNPRVDNIIPMAEDWDKTNYDLAHQILTEKLKNAGDFNFVFVGNIDEEKLKSFAEKYLAVLPSSGEKETYKDLGYRPVRGTHIKEYFKGNDPKSYVDISYYGETNYDEKEDLAMDALAEVIGLKLIEKLREEEGGTYTSSVSGGLSKIPYESYSFRITFPCGPENVDRLIEITKAEIERVIQHGPDVEDLHKFKMAEINDYNEKSKENRTWMSIIASEIINPESKNRYLNFLAKLDELTAKDVQDVAQKYLTQDYVQAVLYPEENQDFKPKAEKTNVSSDDVLNNYYQKIGGKSKIDNIKSSKLQTSIEANGVTFNAVILQLNDNMFKNTMSFGGVEIITLINAEEAYKIQSGVKSDMQKEEIEQNKKQSAMSLLRLPSMKNEVDAYRDNNVLYYVLKTADEHFTFNAESGLLVKKEDLNSGVINLYFNWKDFDGILFPTQIKIINQGQNMNQEVQSLVFNKEVALSDFN